MADPTPTEKLAEQLRVRANEYASLDVDKLTRKDRWNLLISGEH